MAAKIDPRSITLRAFSVIEAVLAAERAMALSEVMASVKLPKPTVYRICMMLEEAGLLIREPSSRRYSIGPALARMGISIMMNAPNRAPRHAILQNLVEEIGETCNLTMLEGSEVVYIDRVETAWPLRLTLQSGSHVPLHCSASGKLLLAYLPRAQRERVLARLSLHRYTGQTLTERAALERELEKIRNEEVSFDREEYLAGLVCVAVPVMTQSRRAIAAVAIQAPIARMKLDEALQHVPALRRAAIEVAETFAT